MYIQFHRYHVQLQRVLDMQLQRGVPLRALYSGIDDGLVAVLLGWGCKETCRTYWVGVKYGQYRCSNPRRFERSALADDERAFDNAKSYMIRIVAMNCSVVPRESKIECGVLRCAASTVLSWYERRKGNVDDETSGLVWRTGKKCLQTALLEMVWTLSMDRVMWMEVKLVEPYATAIAYVLASVHTNPEGIEQRKSSTRRSEWMAVEC